jgi:hypothetical protein
LYHLGNLDRILIAMPVFPFLEMLPEEVDRPLHLLK